MTVYELIQELSKHEPDTEVHVTGDGFGFGCHLPIEQCRRGSGAWNKWVYIEIEIHSHDLDLDGLNLEECR